MTVSRATSVRFKNRIKSVFDAWTKALLRIPKTWRDTFIIASVLVVSLALAVKFDAFDRFYELTRPLDRFGLDELLIILLALPLFCSLLALRWLQGMSRLVWKPDGTDSHVLGVMQDITEHKEAEQAAKHAADERTALAEIGSIINSSLDINDVYERFSEEMKKLIPFDRIVIVLTDPRNDTMKHSYVVGGSFSSSQRGTILTMAGTHVSEIVRRRRGIIYEELNDGDLMARYPRLAPLVDAGFRSSVSVPLISKDQILGVLHLNSKKPGAYTGRELLLTERVGDQISSAIANSQLYEERKRAEESLREAIAKIRLQSRELIVTNTRLEKASQAKSDFLTTVSHELRTPLNATLGFARLLTEPAVGSLNERQSRFVNNILTSGSHLLKLINDLIDLSRIESETIKLELVEMDLAACLTSCQTIAVGMVEDKNILINMKIPPEDVTILGDERRIKQIIFNLLGNAIKFTPNQGEVSLDCSLTPEAVLISISDTGIGVAAEYHHQIFEPFNRGPADVAAEFGGFGLGLPLVKQLAELHGGKVRVISDSGAGSTFNVLLPRISKT